MCGTPSVAVTAVRRGEERTVRKGDMALGIERRKER